MALVKEVKLKKFNNILRFNKLIKISNKGS